jgi:polyadenylate-binding protein
MNSTENQKTILFISELPDNILDTELYDFFSAYKPDIYTIQIDRNQKMYDLFNTRKPKATIYFRNHSKAKEAREQLNMKRVKGKALNIMWHERDNSIRYNNEANLFVKGISRDANPRDIYELFAKYGEIISCKICEDEDGNLLGYGYINYYNLDSAEKAILNLNKTKFKDCELEVQHFKKMNERFKTPSENKSIYIKNIPNSIQNIDELKKIFSKYGKITWGELFKDSSTRNYAILDFETVEGANKAKEEMNDKKINESDESGLYVDFLQKKSERKRMLTTKIGDINNKLNQEFKNCNLYVKNLPYELTEEKMKEIFSKCGEIKSVKISQFILVTKVKDKFENFKTSHGYGFVCYTSEEGAKNAIKEFNQKYLPGFENPKKPPIIISPFMPKHERKQFLNQQSAQNIITSPMMPNPFMYPPMYRPIQNRPRMYRRPQHPINNKIQPQQNPIQNNNIQNKNQMNNVNQNNNVVNHNVSVGNKEDEPNYEYLLSLDNIELQKDYLGEYLFKKIEQHPIAHNKNLTVDVISRITGMILGIDDIKEIYDITVNNESITARINEALTLLENQK